MMSQLPQVRQTPLMVCRRTIACTWLPQFWHAQRTRSAGGIGVDAADAGRTRRWSELPCRRAMSGRYPEKTLPNRHVALKVVVSVIHDRLFWCVRCGIPHRKKVRSLQGRIRPAARSEFEAS
jgi:hypothetical protein